MRAARVLSFCALAFFSGLGDRALAQSYVERSDACVALIKRLNPGTHIRDGLSENACGLTTPPQDFEGAPQHTWLASGAACQGNLPELPRCGLEASFGDGFDGALRRITLSDGKCLHVIPVMLTDKTDGFSCNAVRARPACVAGVRQSGDATIVTLSGGVRSPITADIRIMNTAVRHEPLMTKSRSGPLMALLPGDMTFKSNERDALGFIKHYVAHTQATCSGSAAHCREQKVYQADRAIGELMRRTWNPRPLLTAADRQADYRDLLTYVSNANLGAFDREKKLFAKLIMQNEVSGSSPYQMLDAVIRNSGISWGAHQIDIGANGSSEVTLFWDTLRRWRQARGTGDYPKLRELDQIRACLSQPIRNFFVDHIAAMYGALPDMNKGFRSAMSKAAYQERFKRYLDEEVPRGVGLSGLFKKSPFAWIYFIDQRNQRGTAKADKLRVIGEGMGTGALETCAGVEAGEARLVTAIKDMTEVGDHYDIDRRVKNLKDFLRQEYGSTLGRTCRAS